MSVEDATTMRSEKFELGMALFRKIDPQVADSFMDLVSDISPEFASYTVEFVLGEVLSREGLDLRTRELVAIGTLAAMGTVAPQLEMHIGGALRNGATKQEVVEVILQVAVYAGFATASNALRIAKKVFSADGTADIGAFWT